MSIKNYQIAYTKLNNYQYLHQGGVSSSSRVTRLKYNTLSPTPVIKTTPIYDGVYQPPTFKKNHFPGNTYYPGTREGKRNKYYNYQSWNQTNKIVQNVCTRKSIPSQKKKIYIKTTFSFDHSNSNDDFFNNMMNGKSYISFGNKEEFIPFDPRILSTITENNDLEFPQNIVDGSNINSGNISTDNLQGTASVLPDGNTQSHHSSNQLKFEGDVTHNNVVDILDVQYLMNWLASQPLGYKIFNQDVTYSVNGQKYRLDTYRECPDDPSIPDGEGCPCDSEPLENDNINYERLHIQLRRLYENAGQYIKPILDQFIDADFENGDFENIKQLLTTPYYEQLSVLLYDEKCERFEYYEHLRLMINSVLEVLSKTITLEADLQNEINRIKTELRNCRNPAAPIFELETAVETVAAIRPEYVRYIQLYGMPDGGVFDVDRLAEIIKQVSNESPGEEIV